MADAEAVELELGFDGGGIVRCTVARDDGERLAHAFAGGSSALVELATEGGPLVVDLRRVAYVRELDARLPIGFGNR
jgi:hypothetical protein